MENSFDVNSSLPGARTHPGHSDAVLALGQSVRTKNREGI